MMRPRNLSGVFSESMWSVWKGHKVPLCCGVKKDERWALLLGLLWGQLQEHYPRHCLRQRHHDHKGWRWCVGCELLGILSSEHFLATWIFKSYEVLCAPRQHRAAQQPDPPAHVQTVSYVLQYSEPHQSAFTNHVFEKAWQVYRWAQQGGQDRLHARCGPTWRVQWTESQSRANVSTHFLLEQPAQPLFPLRHWLWKTNTFA